MTREDFYKLIGLLTLAKEHNAALEAIKLAAVEVTGEGRDDGHTADAIYEGYSANVLLTKLGIEVEDAA